MITDAEFWMEVRRKQSGGDTIFRGMLALLHVRQVRLDARVGTLDNEEFMLSTTGRERRDMADGRCLSSDHKRALEEAKKRRERELKELDRPMEANKAFLPNLQSAAGVPATQLRRVATITVRVLQQVMMFAVPIYPLRYNIPAMSMSWNTSCFIDRLTKQLITFGAGQGVKVPQLLHGRGCVAGDGFFAILSDCDEVWASGGLKVSSSSVSGPTPLGREEAMTGIAAKTLMLVGHGQRLASVTRAFTVRPLSALSNPTRSIIPSRHVRFLDLGYGEDYYMVGTDSIVYKTTASKRAVSTPRRVMTLSRMLVSRIASGTSFLLIIDQSGHLYSLGRNRKGQLGNGEKQDARRKPHCQDSLTRHFFTQVAAGDCHSLALTSSGVVYGAGSNESGQLGLGPESKEVLSFTEIPLPQKCIGIAAGPAGSMFALEDGQVLACGLNDCMQLGVEAAVKIVYEPTPISILQAGVESYTMDFGGFRRPDPDDNTESMHWDPMEGAPGQQQPSPPPALAQGVNHGQSGAGQTNNAMMSHHNVNASEGHGVSIGPNSAPDGGGAGGGDGVESSLGHGVALNDATVIRADHENPAELAAANEGSSDLDGGAQRPAAGAAATGTSAAAGTGAGQRAAEAERHPGKRSKDNNKQGDGKVRPGDKTKTEGGCKCCTVM